MLLRSILEKVHHPASKFASLDRGDCQSRDDLCLS